MIYYFGLLIFNFIFDSAKNRLLCYFCKNIIKKLRYTDEWHNNNRYRYLADSLDWIIV